MLPTQGASNQVKDRRGRPRPRSLSPVTLGINALWTAAETGHFGTQAVAYKGPSAEPSEAYQHMFPVSSARMRDQAQADQAKKVESTTKTPPLSPAARTAAAKARSFKEYLFLRIFTFYHLFSGAGQYGIGQALQEGAARRGMQVRHVSVDRDKNGDDLLADEPYGTLLKDAQEHKCDGSNCGPVCSLFSAVRFRPGGASSGAKFRAHIRTAGK